VNENKKSETENTPCPESNIGIPVQVTIVVPQKIPYDPALLKSNEDIHGWRVVQGEDHIEALGMAIVAAAKNKTHQDALAKLIAAAWQFKEDNPDQNIDVYYSTCAGVVPEERL